MDSNFSVKITADISELQSRMAAVEAITGKFKKSMDDASGSVKNMEQNANRGRMVAFAFGQVIRDAGFFANSFSLGILAISNNVPILIDQLSLSVKALQPFAGALSLIGSLLTAGLTIWAYSSQAVNKNSESIEDYMNKLDDLRQTKINAASDAKSELIDLENLRKASQNQALSVRDRKKAIDELRDRWPDYYNGLSDETIMAGRDADAHRRLANAILAVAKVQADKDKIVQNSKKIDILYQKQQDKRLEQERFLSQSLLQVRNKLIEEGIDTESKYFKNYMAQAKQRIKSTDEYLKYTQEINSIEATRGELLYSNIQLSEDMQKLIATTGTVSITGDYGKPAEQAKDIWQEFADTLRAINFDPTLTDIERLNKTLDAHKTLLKELSTQTYQGVGDDIKMVTGEMDSLQSQIEKLNKTKQVNDLLSDFGSKIKDINSNIGATSDVIKNQTVEAIDDLINKLLEIGGFSDLIVKLQNMKNGIADTSKSIRDEFKQLVADIALSMESVGYALATGGNVGAAFGSSILNAIGDFLVKFGLMIVATSKAGQALAKAMQNIFDPSAWGKSLVAGLALIALGGAAKGFASSMSRGSSGRGGGGNNMTKSPSPTSMPSFSMPTTFQTSSIGMSTGFVASTKISGNDLAIIIGRADKNRKNYYGG